MNNFDLFFDLPIMGILRGIKQDMIKPLSDTILKSGLKTIEITMNTKNAPQLISELKSLSNGAYNVG
ncbi:MAG: hypothetical protein JXB17_10060, partial [Bacteroidales bacterium]|nr:hypothetical protein [Bacteroidales bacterium]